MTDAGRFTPGPWAAEPNEKAGRVAIMGARSDGNVRSSDGLGWLAEVDAVRMGHHDDAAFPPMDAELVANAALIAAAPDLYEALKDALREAEEHYCDIIGARDAMFQDNVPPKVAAAYREELVRMDGVISRARAALSKATVKPGGAPQADASVPPQSPIGDGR